MGSGLDVEEADRRQGRAKRHAGRRLRRGDQFRRVDLHRISGGRGAAGHLVGVRVRARVRVS